MLNNHFPPEILCVALQAALLVFLICEVRHRTNEKNSGGGGLKNQS